MATVYCNGRELGTHKGGFSTFRYELTPAMKAEGNVLTVTVTNAILATADRVESNKIGLKTCEKLLTAMGGSFRQFRSDDTFTVEVILPLYQA